VEVARGLGRLTETASDVRRSVRRARARRRRQVAATGESASAAEITRRLDETRARLRSEIPPRAD
jgi:hypothetical protein